VASTLERDYAAFGDPPEQALGRRRIDLEVCRYFGVRWEPGKPLGTWILPIRSPKRSLWGWQRKKGKNVTNHPTGVHTGLTLFGLDRFKEGSLAVLVESPLDVLVLHRHGYHALSSFGAGIGAEQLRLIRQRADRLMVAFDNDIEGRLASHRLLCDQRVRFTQTWVMNYRYTTAKDPGEMASDELEVALEIAIPATTWLIESHMTVP
jgi:hypothetical protein